MLWPSRFIADSQGVLMLGMLSCWSYASATDLSYTCHVKCLHNHKKYRIVWKDQINMGESLHEFAFFELQNVHFFSSQSNIKNYFKFKFSSSKGSISDFRKWKQWYKIIFSLKFLPVYPLFNFRKKPLEGVKKHLHSSPFQSIILEIITQISKDLQRFYSFFTLLF